MDPQRHFMLDAALANTPSLTFPVSTGLASWTYHPVTPVVRATPSPGEQQKRRGSAKWPCTPPTQSGEHSHLAEEATGTRS